jgi:hypothetical protein
VFIDLKGAYDGVNHRLLLEKLIKCGVRGKLLNYCQSFLKDRKFAVFYNGENSDTKNIRVGVPQGASISPLLFNIFLSDIPNFPGVTRTEYADDLALVVKGKSVLECTVIMQQALDTLYQYINVNKLQINCQKTVSMLFTRKRVAAMPLNVNQYNVTFVPNYKFLGVTFDSPDLNYKQHISDVKVQYLSRINIMKAISHNSWGADRLMLIRIYDALVSCSQQAELLCRIFCYSV